MLIIITMREYLSNPFIAAIIAGLLIIIVIYIDDYINERNFEKSYYVKMFIVVAGIVGIIVYLITNTHVIQNGGSDMKNLMKKMEDVYSDMPEF
jgi:hypothetical protein